MWQLILGLLVGYYGSKVLEALRSFKTNVLVGQKGRPGVAVATTEETTVVGPKSPQLVDWEEEQELKKMNPGRF